MKYSLVIPTHNRHNFMHKNIEYFSNFQNVQIYICDSSSNSFQGFFPSNITYLHMPEKDFVSKMKDVLQILKTSYVCVCADDDYVIEKSVIQMLQQMKSDNYTMAVGKYAGFDIPFSGLYELYQTLPLINNTRSDVRVNSYLFRYYMSLWAIYDVKILLKAYTVLSQARYTNHNFIELTIAIACASEGRILFYDELYGIREGNNNMSKNWAKGHKNLFHEYIFNHTNFVIQVNSLEKSYNDIFEIPLYKRGIYAYLLGFIYAKLSFKIKNVLNLDRFKKPILESEYKYFETIIKRHQTK